jgi:hypothetical protein
VGSFAKGKDLFTLPLTSQLDALFGEDAHPSQATKHYGGFGWLASVMQGFPACRWRKTIHRMFCWLPILLRRGGSLPVKKQ